MPSSTIDQFQFESHLVTTGAAEVADVVGVALAERLRPFLEAGETPIDWVLAQTLIGRMLGSKVPMLDGIDRQLEIERAEIRQLRADRDRIAAQLRRHLRSARLLADESFRPGVAAGVVVKRAVSAVRASRLPRLARETAEKLRSPDLLPSLAGGLEDLPDPQALAGLLERRAQELEAQLELLGPKAKRQTLAVGAKNEKWQEASDLRLRGQDLLFGLYRAAGFDHLAARLRAKRPRKAEADRKEGRKPPSPKPMPENRGRPG